MNVQSYVLSDEEIKESLHYTACGLEDVYLLNGYEIHETDYGSGVSVNEAEDLHLAIGLDLIQNKKFLAGKELRFLRRQMDLTQSELGRLLGLSAQQVARWEKDKQNITGPVDRLLRMLFQEHAGGAFKMRELLESLDVMDDPVDERQVFSASSEGWRAAAG